MSQPLFSRAKNARFLLVAFFAFWVLPAGVAQAQTLNATFNAATDVPVTANGYTASGTVNFTLNCALPTGTNLTVVNNTSLSFINGNFSNLAQGQAVALNYGGITYNFVANYYGGTGNDLVLVWANNSVLTWGGDSDTPLYPNFTSTPGPLSTSGMLAGKTIIATAAGESHSLALCSDGTLAAWGYSYDGQLGNNSYGYNPVPVAVYTGGVLSGKTVVAISAGQWHSVALCSDGTLAAWGYNYDGELGNGSQTYSSVPVAVDMSGAFAGKNVVAVSAGGTHNLALCSDGTVIAWGGDFAGQAGNGATSNITAPVAVDTSGVLAGKTVISVSAGYLDSMALCSDGTVVTWGYNTLDELGNSSTANSSDVPVLVDTSGVLAGKTVVAAVAGGAHNLVLCSDGSLASWGYDGQGQLGNNSTTNSSVPVAVNTAGTPVAGKTVVALGGGLNHSLLLCSDGTLATWGDNTVGELGNGTTTGSLVPVAANTSGLAAGAVITLVTSGPYASHTVALAAVPPSPQIVVQQPSGTSLTSGLSIVNFGSTPAGVGVPLTFTLLNNGSAPLAISSVTFDGLNASDYMLTTAPASSVAVGSSTAMQVTFTPAAALQGYAVMHIASNDPGNGVFNVPLLGSSPGTFTATFNSAADVPLTVPAVIATGSTINFTLNSTLPAGTNLTVIRDTGLGSIQGAFSNLAQGQSVTLSFGGYVYSFVANYYGGAGNDLVLQWANTRLVSWGENVYGLSGTGGTDITAAPLGYSLSSVFSGTAGRALSILASNNHNLAISLDGSTLAAWGDDTYGQLGDGSHLTSDYTPEVIASILGGKQLKTLAAGQYTGGALCTDGTVATWGYLNGVENNSPTLITASGALSGKTVVSMAAGTNHMLVLCSDGTVYTWGSNNNGLLGDGGNESGSNVPVAVSTASGSALFGKKIVAIAAGNNHSLVLCSDGTLAAWGDNSSGQLGVASPSFSNVPLAVNAAAGSALFGKTVRSFVTGGLHNLVLCTDGTLVSWGDDTSNQLGIFGASGSFVSTPSVVYVGTGSALSGKTITSIAAGWLQSYALCSDGTLASWGNNSVGQLGLGSFNGFTGTPLAVSTASFSTGEVFTQVFSGHDAYECFAVVAEPNTPRLSVASSFSVGASPVGTPVSMNLTVSNTGTAPLLISGATIDGVDGTNFTVSNLPASLGAQSSTTLTVTFTPGALFAHTAALHLTSNDPTNGSSTTTLTGQGSGTASVTFNSASDVGYTTTSCTATGSTMSLTLNFAPTPGTQLTVVNNTGSSFIQGAFTGLTQGQVVSLPFGGINYTFVANYYGGTGNDFVLQWASNRLTSWGYNFNGQLGNATTNSSNVPVAVVNAGVLAGKTILGTAAGGAHSLAVCSDGTVAAWGMNGFGQLGNGSSNGISSTIPVLVSTTNGSALSGKTVVAVAAGADHSVALCSDGTLAAWGFGGNGQLGNNSSNTVYAPVSVTTTGILSGKTVIAIAAGASHTLALCSNGALASWGNNSNGQLGIGNTSGRAFPSPVLTNGVLSGKTIVAIAAGANHSLALCSDGTLAAWGLNSNGQLGNGSTTQSTSPTLVTTSGVLSGKTVVAIAAGTLHSLALCSDGTLAAWGGNTDGQLGNNSFSQSTTPVLVRTTGVLSGKTVVAISAGVGYSLASCSDGTLASWGFDTDGELGDGGATHSSVPVKVLPASTGLGEVFVTATSGQSADHSFGLVAEPVTPIAFTVSGSSMSTTAATLNGTASPDGNDTTITFQYGTTTSYGSSTTPQDLGVTGVGLPVTASLTGLSPHTQYHFQLVATSAAGTSNGGDMTFKTANSIPKAKNDTVNNVTGGTTIPVLSNDSDADGDSLTITSVSQGSNGGVTTDGTTATYTPGTSFAGAGTDTFSYTISDGFGGTATANVTVNAVGIGTWRAQTFGANAGNATISGDNADPNNNGIPNLMEYALNGDATGSSTGTSILPQVSPNPTTGTMQLSFTRYQDRTDITLIVQATDSLTGTWTNLAQSVHGAPFTIITTGATVNESGTGNAISVTVGDLYQMTDPNHPHRFMRLQVTRP